MMNEKKVSQAVASAITSLAVEENKINELYQDLINLQIFNKENQILIDYLKNPWILKADKIKNVMSLSGSFQFDKTVNLLAILIKGNIVHLFSKVTKNTLINLEELLGIINLKIYSAFILNDEQINQIANAIKNTKSILPSNFTKLNTQLVVDESIIGGIKVEINSKVIDNTLIEKIKQAQQANILRKQNKE